MQELQRIGLQQILKVIYYSNNNNNKKNSKLDNSRNFENHIKGVLSIEMIWYSGKLYKKFLFAPEISQLLKERFL